MLKRELWGVFWLAVGIIAVVLVTLTHLFDKIIIAAALGVLGLLVFLMVSAALIYGRKFVEDHPYIPYLGRYAHVLCKECGVRGHEPGRIEVNVGYAFEGWGQYGYFRGFMRLYSARCSSGHEWKFDPMLQRNEVAKKDAKPRHARSEKVRAAAIKRMREVFHVTFVEPHLHPEFDEAAGT